MVPINKSYSLCFLLQFILLFIHCEVIKDDDSSTAITFQKQLLTGGGNAIQQTKDEGYIIAGFTEFTDSVYPDAVFIKTDKFGDLTWKKISGGPDFENGITALQTYDGGFVLGVLKGMNERMGVPGLNQEIVLIKTDFAGKTLWSKNIDKITSFRGFSNFNFSIQQTVDSGFIMVSTTDSLISGNLFNRVYLVKLDKTGNVVWTRIFGENDHVYGRVVQQTSDLGFIIATHNSLIKTDSVGNQLWETNIDDSFQNMASLLQTSDGGFIIGCYKDLQTHYTTALLKTDLNGNLLWTSSCGGNCSTLGASVKQTNDGGFILAGRECTAIADTAFIYIVKTDCNANLLWSKVIKGDGCIFHDMIQQCTDGGFIMTGATPPEPNYGKILIIKTDELGNIN